MGVCADTQLYRQFFYVVDENKYVKQLVEDDVTGLKMNKEFFVDKYFADYFNSMTLRSSLP